MSELRVILTGGGTGGHVYPLLALAESAPAATKLIFAGSRKPSDAAMVHAAAVPFVAIDSGAILGRRMDRRAASLVRTARGVVQGMALLRRVRPAAVVSTGGYAGFPVARAASVLRIPLILIEPNAVPGMSTRALAKRARLTCGGFARTARELPRAVWTGAPVRANVMRGDAARARAAYGLREDRFTVLVLGGSQGAATINRAVAEAASRLDDASGVQILHQTGAARAGLSSGAAAPGVWYVQTEYLHEIGDAYALADLVVARAGALTCAEIAAVGRAAVLVPLPGAAGHQEDNARELTAAGGASTIADAALSGAALAEIIRALRADPDRLARMASAARTVGRPDAAARVWREIEGVLER